MKKSNALKDLKVPQEMKGGGGIVLQRIKSALAPAEWEQFSYLLNKYGAEAADRYLRSINQE